MSQLLSFPPGWTLNAPAGTVFGRVDVHMNTRPGAGGYCAILEASDWQDTVLLRGGNPATDTLSMISRLTIRLAEEIGGNRAVIICRNPTIKLELEKAFKPFPMIRILGNMPLAVADATRHAAVMAERAKLVPMIPTKDITDLPPLEERLLSARFQPNSEEFHSQQDTATAHSSINALLDRIGFGDLQREDVRKAAQGVLDATENARLAQLQKVVKKVTANDLPRATTERKMDHE